MKSKLRAWMYVHVLACLALVAALPAVAQEYALRAEPAWVESMEIPAKDASPRASDGTRYLLVDDQIDTTRAKPHWYRRSVYALELERALSDGGQFNIEYEPEYQRVELHAIDVLRDGQRLHRLSSARLQVLRREDELESGILDGRHTLNVTIPDLRVGDVVDYRYSVVGFNPIFGNAYYDAYSARWGVPVGERRVRALYRAARPLHWRAPKAYSVTTSVADDRHVVDIRASKLPRVRTEDDVPGSFDPWGRVELTTAKEWRDIVHWALPLYPTRFKDRALAATLVERLGLHDADKRAALARAVAYVQGEIRYTALDMGQNSHAPYAPETTVARRFGDCKDKASLLAALLAEAGIEAHPVLVNTEVEDGVRAYAPSAYGFDHVVARARLDGRDVWIDGTRDKEVGPFEARTPLPFKAGLPVCAGCDGFVEIPAPIPARPEVEVNEVITLRDDAARYIADLIVLTDYRNERAVSVRDRFEDEELETLAEEYLGYMRGFYEDATRVADPVVESAGEAQTRLTERYRVSWKHEDGDTFGIVLFQLNDFLPELTDKARRMPLSLSGPRFAKQTIRTKNESGWSIKTESDVVENRYFRFFRTVRVQGGDLVVIGEWQRLRDVVTAADYAAVRKDLERARDLLTYDIDIALTSDEMISDQRLGWPLAALALVGIAGFFAWRLRGRVHAAGMLFRPRATVAQVLASPGGRVSTGLLLIALATVEVAFGSGAKYVSQEDASLGKVLFEWLGYFLKFSIFVAVLGWGFRLLSAPIGYRNLFVSTVWAIAPPLLIGSIAAIVAVGGDMSVWIDESVFSDDQMLAMVTAAALLIGATAWSAYAAITSYSAAANVSRGHAFGATVIGLVATIILFVPAVISGLFP